MIVNKQAIRIGTNKDLQEVFDIFSRCKTDLDKKGIYQWDENYPNVEYFADKILKEELYILESAEKVLGAFVMDESQPEEWERINWQKKEEKFLVLHSVFLEPEHQGSGYGKTILSFAEDFANRAGYRTIRLDAFSKNMNSVMFYDKNGYIKRGEVTFTSKPINNQVYYCFEKVLK